MNSNVGEMHSDFGEMHSDFGEMHSDLYRSLETITKAKSTQSL